MALIAVERDVGLGGIAESGTRINADLSAPLLNTIFFPNTELHDLGVVVSQGRIAYAGVQFPLAESDELERELGSRHRAAVGLARKATRWLSWSRKKPATSASPNAGI